MIDNDYNKATYSAIVAAVLSALGFMHAPKLSILYDYKFALGYVIMAGIFFLFKYTLKNYQASSQSDNDVSLVAD